MLGAIGALFLVRLVLAVVQYIASRKRNNVRTLVVLGSGGGWGEPKPGPSCSAFSEALLHSSSLCTH